MRALLFAVCAVMPLQTVANTGIAATAPDRAATVIVLTDTPYHAPGCAGRPMAVSVPPRGHPIRGCYMADPTHRRIRVRWFLEPSTVWFETYSARLFTLTPYGEAVLTAGRM